ncbi:MAG: Mov34/MPN/PAD-1 family protein [Candidatus Thermoplasmatota archaeon]|jgi:proteasome lid subunit RPN8/RPN11|nr:Mov34/MPN/PAD-1 family protein [Candidatus Thermoplasmatota archaeon]
MKIRKGVIDLVMESSKDSLPNEFAALLKAKRDVIYEIALLPGTISGDRSAIMQLWARPMDLGYVGTIHSHPSGVIHPSDEDRNLYSKFGNIHIIVGYPFNSYSWRAFNNEGIEIKLEMIP